MTTFRIHIRHYHRPFRHTLVYWLFGFWMLEAMGWMLYATAIGTWYFMVKILPLIAKGMALAFLAIVALIAAGAAYLRGRARNGR